LILPSELNHASLNDAADFYYYKWGNNITYANTQGKITNATWGALQHGPLLEAEHQRRKDNGDYNNGIGIIMGPFWNNPLMENKFLNCVDIDNKPAHDEFCTRDGRMYSLEELNKKFPIERHPDDPYRFHAYIITFGRPLKTKAIKNLSDPNVLAIDIKGNGMMFSTPSTHKAGTKYQFPYGLKAIEEYEVQDPDVVEKFLDNICKKHGLDYLNGEASKDTKGVPIDGTDNDDDDDIKWYQGERGDKLYKWARSLYLDLGDKIPPEDIKALVYAKDKRKCKPSLTTDNPLNQIENICKSAKKWADKKRAENTEKKKKSKLVIEKARKNTIKFFVDEYKQAHVAVKVNDHLEILALHTSRFKDWLSRRLYKEDNIVVDSNTFRDAIGVLNAEAVFDSGEPIKLNLRVAQRIEPIIAGGAIDTRDSSIRILWYYDLTNNNHEFIETTSEGWSVVKNTEQILFRRFNNQASQVYPLSSGEKGTDVFNEFIELLLDKNVKDENKKDYRHLLKVYIICLFIPEISKPVLLPYGSEGALKSTIFEKIKDIVDPSILKTLSFPRDKNEFIQQLGHNYVAYYDNISSLKYWISDEICRAVSGSGSSVRKLYTDDDDKIRSFKRCIGINGINLAATKPDLLDRGLQFELIRINKSDRLKEETINKKFQELRPYVLGYIFDTLVKVLRFKETEKIELKEFPRMADFAEYGEIISRCMGYRDNAFIDVYNRNTELRIDEVIESSEVARCLMYMMFEKYKDGFMKIDGSKTEDWIGTPSQLLGELNTIAISETSDLNIDVRDTDWPKAAHILTRRINEIMSTLKEKGIEIEYLTNQGEEKSRGIKIRKIASIASPASTDEKGA
jgi:hypothetical protein